MKEFINKLKNEPKNDAGYIRRILAYAIDWYLGSVISSIPLILLYMSLHDDATYIPQLLSIFESPYDIIAGVLSFSTAILYYVGIPIFVWPGQTLGKKLLGLKIVSDDYEVASAKQIIIRELLMILIVEGSIYSNSNMLHQLITVITGYNFSSFYSYVGVVISLFSAILVIILKSKKSLHDIVAKTIVINIHSNQYQYQLKKNRKLKKKQLKNA
ncbi:MAG: RDD family protein [Erysipelotrichaceae bacterium]|nr:RDD family protein [Erysipelotrichaceae bacterium]